MSKHDTATLLQLPILSLFDRIPPEHWLRHHRRHKLRAHHFFMFDSISRRIRPLLPPDSPEFPRLSSWLLCDLNNRTISWTDCAWSLILQENSDIGTVDDSPFVFWFTRSVQWSNFHPKLFREDLTTRLLPCSSHPLSTTLWQKFWSLQLPPEARSI